MSYQDEIDKAINAHGAWKQRLRSAIAEGCSTFSVAQVQVDNQCDFGKWLYGLPVPLQESYQGKKVQHLHALFHNEAARILDLALRGSGAEAEKALDSQSQFTSLSGQLTMALIQWKKDLG